MIKLHFDLIHFKLKVLVDNSIDQQPTILSFLTRVLRICSISDIDPQELQLYDGDFILPHLLSSKYIRSDGNYTIRNTKVGKREAKENKQNQKKKQKRNKKRIVESEIQSSSEEQIVAVQNKIYKNKPKHMQMKKPLPTQNQSKSLRKNDKNKNSLQSKNKQKQIVSQSGSSSDSDASLPVISKRKGTGPISNTQEEIQKGNCKKFEKVPTDYKSLSSTQKIKSKNIISKVQQILSTVNQKKHQSNKDQGQLSRNTNPSEKRNQLAKAVVETKSMAKKKLSDKNISRQSQLESAQQKQPVAERARPKQFHSFKQYQQSKWVSITKQNLKQWENAHQDLPIFDPQNSIRFKVVQLDEQKFVPVTTGWISGTIQKSEKKGSNTLVDLINVSKCPANSDGSSEFLKQFSVPLHNMQELQINKGTLTSHQKQIIQTEEQKKQCISKQQIEQATNKEPEKQQQSLNDYVCSQVNYYFSDKNYPQDLFLIMNANKDQGKYIDVRFMTNFGKIKKVVSDHEKLWEFLVNDEQSNSRNYELDLERKMLRRK